jgi:purine-binding chemotaxis protein CheW
LSADGRVPAQLWAGEADEAGEAARLIHAHHFRLNRFRSPRMSDATVPTHQLVVFSLGREEYAAPITRVQEIIDWTEPRTVSSDVPWMRGVISLRGKIVPVCDLGARLGIGATAGGDKIVIVEAGGDQAGVIVDEVTEVLTVAETQLEDIAVADEELVQGIAKVDDRLIVLLNLDGVFAATAQATPAVTPPAAAPAVPTLPAGGPSPAAATV